MKLRYRHLLVMVIVFVLFGMVYFMRGALSQGQLVKSSIQFVEKIMKQTEDSFLIQPAFRLGEVHQYSVKQHVIIKSHQRDQPVHVSDVLVTGEWQEQAIGVDKNFLLLAVSLKNPSVEIIEDGMTADKSILEKLRDDFSYPLYIRLNHFGLLEKVYLPIQAPLNSANILYTIYTSKQFVMNDRKKQNEKWEIEENNATGTYVAQYSLDKIKSEKINIQKSKLSYSHFVNQHGLLVSKDISQFKTKILPETQTIYEVDSKLNIIQKITDVESTTMTSNLADVDKHMITEINFIGKQVNNTAPISENQSEESLIASGQIKTMEKALEEEQTNMEKLLLKNKVNGASLTDILMGLGEKLENKDDEAIFLTFEKLSAYFSLYPENISELVKLVTSLQKQDAFFERKLSVFVGIFTSLKSPEAEKALLGLSETYINNLNMMEQILPAITNFSAPTELSKTRLLDISQQTSNEEIDMLSTFALGSVARRLGEQKNEIPDPQILEYLEQKMHSAVTLRQKLSAIGALGNSSDVRTAVYVKEILARKDIEDEGKSSALYALRLLKEGDADTILSDILTSKPSNTLILGALKVLEFRPDSENSFNLAYKTYYSSIDDNVKTQSAITMSSLSSKVGKDRVREVLQQIITTEKSHNVLEVVKRLHAGI